MSAPGRVKAGFARRDITPREPCFLVGYPHAERTSTGTHDPLFASALCLADDAKVVVLISLDVLFVSADWTRDCRKRIAEATGIEPAAVLISATHTHSGPHTVDILAWHDDPVVPEPDPRYLEFACAETVAAAVAAWKKLEPAELTATSADVRGVAGGNRIDPDGAEDPWAGLLLARRAGGGEPIAILAVYGMHPTVLHEDSTLFSGDFIAFTRKHVERAFPGSGVVYLNGVCGNQSPRRVVTAQTFSEAERIGTALGERLVSALRGTADRVDAVTLDAAVTLIEIEGKSFPAEGEAERKLAEARACFDALRAAKAARAEIRTAECAVFGAEEVLTLARAEVSGEANAARRKYRDAEVQVIRIGDLAVVAWPGEFFVEYGLDVKRRAPGRTWITTMANGELHGYIVTPEAEAAGGYEAQMSLFPASVGRQFVDATIEMLQRMVPR